MYQYIIDEPEEPKDPNHWPTYRDLDPQTLLDGIQTCLHITSYSGKAMNRIDLWVHLEAYLDQMIGKHKTYKKQATLF